jgi:putative transposase
MVRPETVLAWHRQLVTGRARRGGERARAGRRRPSSSGISSCASRGENPRWGYLRIKGELNKLGHNLPATTIRDILRRAGIDPSPRRHGPSWSEFVRGQAASIVAADFFTVYTLWGRVLHVLFFIELSTRMVHVAGCTVNPDGDWVTQQARNFTVHLEGRKKSLRFLIHDRDGKFGGRFDVVFATEGAEVIRTPIRVPRANLADHARRSLT